MGIFKKIFKGIGSGVKWIGRKIMKGFSAVGKFVNKLGIFGQIGMALIMPGLANFAMGALTSLGSGFMASLATTAAGQGFTAGVARVTHAVLSTALEAGSAIKGAVTSVTDTAVGLVTDSARMVGNTISKVGAEIGGPASGSKFFIDPVSVTGSATKTGNQISQTLYNAADKVQTGWGDLATKGKNIGKIVGDTATGKYAPRYETFTTKAEPSLFDRKPISKSVTKEVAYHKADERAWLDSPEHFIKTPEGQAEVQKFLGTEEGTEFLRGDVGTELIDQDTTPLSKLEYSQDPETYHLAREKEWHTQAKPSVSLDPKSVRAEYLPESYYPEGTLAPLSAEQETGNLLEKAWGKGVEGFQDAYPSWRDATKNTLTSAAIQKINEGPGAHDPRRFAYGHAFDRGRQKDIYFETVAARGSGQEITQFGDLYNNDPGYLNAHFPNLQNYGQV